MATTEPTVLAGIMTFFGYCVLPLSIVFYLTGSKRRRQRRETAAQQAARTASPDKDTEFDPMLPTFASAMPAGDDSDNSTGGDTSADCAGSADTGGGDGGGGPDD
jgi:hypothetical protein